MASDEAAKEFLRHIECCAKDALSPENKNTLTPDDRKELEWALRKLQPSFDELSKWFIEPLRDSKPNDCMYGYEQIWMLVSAAFIAGSRGTVTESAKNYYQKAQTKPANESRSAISRIVMRHAEALWTKKPSFRNNAHGTAATIRGAVSAEAAVGSDGTPLKGWPADERTEVERIRKCIDRALAKPVEVEGALD